MVAAKRHGERVRPGKARADGAANLWSVVFIAVVPVLLLACAAVVMMRRRKR